MDKLTESDQRVLSYLQLNATGKNHAVTSQVIARSTGETSRQVRQSILNLRRHGEPVMSSIREPFGYFIPDSAEEAKECLNQLYSRIQEIYKTARSLESGIKEKFSKAG